MSTGQQFWHSVQFFEEKEIHTYFYAKQKLWLFSAIDICNVLIESGEPNKGWGKLKQEVDQNDKSVRFSCVRIFIDGEWTDVDVLRKEEIMYILSRLESNGFNKFESWLQEICNSVPAKCFLSKNERGYEFLNLASNRFLDLYSEINGNHFMKYSSEIRLYKIKDLFSVYTELLLYKPIKEYIDFLEKTRPPMESVLSNEFIKFIRNILTHFPFFKTWDDIYITKDLANWEIEGKTIDKFLNKYKGHDNVEYRFMETQTRKWRYPVVSFPPIL